MKIRQLEVLEAVERTGTFTGAGQALHLTQSAVSHAIAELEQQAGTALFRRMPKGVRLTPCGVSLLREARGVLAAFRNLDQRIAHLEDDTPVNVVSSITIASFLLPAILRAFQASHPKLAVHVRVASANAVLDLLQRGRADIAFWEGVRPQGSYQTVLLGDYTIRLACAPSFPFADESITPEQLCRLPLLLREPGSAIRDTFDSMLALANLNARPVWQSVNSFALIKAAEAGLGVAVLPEDLLADSILLQKLRFIRLTGMEMKNNMFAVLQKDAYLTRPMGMLLEHLESRPAGDSTGWR